MFCFSHFCCFCFRNKIKLKHLHEITCDPPFETVASELIPELVRNVLISLASSYDLHFQALSGLDSLLACESCTKRLEETYTFRKNCSRNIQLLVRYAGELRAFGGFPGDVRIQLIDVGKSSNETSITYGNERVEGIGIVSIVT